MSGSIRELPGLLRAYAEDLPAGMYTPVRYPDDSTPSGVPFVTIFGNVGDDIVEDMDHNPSVEVSVAVRSRGKRSNSLIVLFWIFLRLEGIRREQHLYEIGFNIGIPEMREDLGVLAKQPFYEIITCGESCFTATRVTLPEVGSDITRVLDLSQRHLDVGWSEEEYMRALEDEWELYPDTETLVAKLSDSSVRFEDIL